MTAFVSLSSNNFSLLTDACRMQHLTCAITRSSSCAWQLPAIGLSTVDNRLKVCGVAHGIGQPYFELRSDLCWEPAHSCYPLTVQKHGHTAACRPSPLHDSLRYGVTSFHAKIQCSRWWGGRVSFDAVEKSALLLPIDVFCGSLQFL
jgi:hypothetical protein